MTSRPFATVAIPAVCHVGTLNAADKGREHPGSYEGHGLSVALAEHAEHWERIAQLGGRAWWLLRRDDGRFLDARALTGPQRRSIRDWGQRQGLVQRATVWAYERHDDELGDTVSTLHDTKSGALQQADDEADPHGRVRRTVTLRATSRLRERLGVRAGTDVFDLLAVCYVEDEMPGLDGVWWNDPVSWMWAPRGVILPGRLAGWQARQVTRRQALEFADAQSGWV